MKRRKRLVPQLNNAEAIPPWSVRCERLCKLIHANIALRANTGGGVGTTRGDVHRLIKEGYAHLTLQQSLPRNTARFCISWRYVILTPKGIEVATREWVKKQLLK